MYITSLNIIRNISICAFLGISFLLPQAYAEDNEIVKRDGLTFSIKSAEFLEHTNVTLKENSLSPHYPKQKYSKRDVLAVTFQINNDTTDKKYDLTQGFEFNLTDEFGNIYQTINKPYSYIKPTFYPNEFFPSLYPGNIFAQTVFFEAPLRKSRHMLLLIDALSSGIQEQIILRLPQNNILGVDDYLNRRVPRDKDISILVPKNGTHVSPGDIVYLKIALSEDLNTPESLYIITPDYVLQDSEMNFKYDLRIPHQQEEGPMVIVVMAKWKDNSRFGSISKSFILNVDSHSSVRKNQ